MKSRLGTWILKYGVILSSMWDVLLRWTNACPFAAGDSSQDEAEEDVKQVTVRFLQLFSLLWKVWSHDLCLSRCSLLFNQVRFSRPESEQARQRRTQSYEFLQRKQSEEPWVHLHYHGIKVRVIMWPTVNHIKQTHRFYSSEITFLTRTKTDFTPENIVNLPSQCLKVKNLRHFRIWTCGVK